MKADDLGGVLNVFDPVHMLTPEEINSWFVQRENSPRGRIHTLLQRVNTPQKILLIGHRGTGKTTELRKLAEEIKASYEVINFDPTLVLGVGDLEYEDVMLVIATQVLQHCLEKKLLGQTIGGTVRERLGTVGDWWKRLVAGLEFEQPSGEGSLGLQLTTLLGQIEIGSKQSPYNRDQIKQQLKTQMSELISHLNWMIDSAEKVGGHKLLIVVEGLDKVDLEVAKKIFLEHSTSITSPVCSMIYTFPLALRHADDYPTVLRSFPSTFSLPNIPTRTHDGLPNEPGIELLRRLVLLRMKKELIEDDALEVIVTASGGVAVWLISLVRNAALYALQRPDDEVIRVRDAEQAKRDLRGELAALLSRQGIEMLRQCRHNRNSTNDDAERRLLYNGTLIEYSDEAGIWYDAHPVLWSLLGDLA